jgi:LPS export ABC transporter protein LptC
MRTERSFGAAPLRWLALLLAVACGESGADPMIAEFDNLPADHVMTEMEFYATSSGIRAAKLLADTAYMYEDSTVSHLRGVALDMFDAAGVTTAHLTSVTGRFDSQSQAMTATGSVVLQVLRDGRKIETEQLHYDPETRRLWSDVQTRMTEADGNVTTAASFTADDQFRNIQFQNARGRVRERITF